MNKYGVIYFCGLADMSSNPLDLLRFRDENAFSSSSSINLVFDILGAFTSLSDTTKNVYHCYLFLTLVLDRSP